MRRYMLLLAVVLTLLCCQSGVWAAYTMSFEDASANTVLDYYTQTYGITFLPGFTVVDRTGESWGPARSASHVLMWTASSNYVSRIEFGETNRYETRSLGAFFSTDQGCMVEMRAYNSAGSIITTTTIGEEHGSWTNQYAEVNSPISNSIAYVDFVGIGSADSRLGFTADDMSVQPVPEPSGFIVLLSAIGGIPLLRRRISAGH